MIIQKRIDYHPNFYKNKFYHVYNKAIGNDKLFYNDQNYKHFLKRYSYYLGEKLKTYAFCLIQNHFHLLVSPIVNEPEVIIEQFRKLFISYSMSINKQQKRKGNLFNSNFKRKIIDDNNYLMQVVYYIHANPLHHGIVSDFTSYKYSSYKKITGTKITRLQRKEVLTWFGGLSGFIKYHSERRPYIFTEAYTIEDE